MTDVMVSNHGTIFLFTPVTENGRRWIGENVGDDVMWFAGGLAVEHGYARQLAEGMLSDGLEVT